MIDYLQLMSVPGNSENRATEISEISRSLKGLARELNVPVIALSQLNTRLTTWPTIRSVRSSNGRAGRWPATTAGRQNRPAPVCGV